MDILNAIDDLAVHHCGYCDASLGPEARSRYFCNEEHQAAWNTARSEDRAAYERTPRQAPFPGLYEYLAALPDGAIYVALHTSPPITQATDNSAYRRTEIQWTTTGPVTFEGPWIWEAGALCTDPDCRCSTLGDPRGGGDEG